MTQFLMDGFLLKKKHDDKLHSTVVAAKYQKRFFQLTSEALSYASAAKDIRGGGGKVEVFPLNEVLSIKVVDGVKLWIKLPHRILRLKADSELAAEYWSKTIEMARQALAEEQYERNSGSAQRNNNNSTGYQRNSNNTVLQRDSLQSAGSGDGAAPVHLPAPAQRKDNVTTLNIQDSSDDEERPSHHRQQQQRQAAPKRLQQSQSMQPRVWHPPELKTDVQHSARDSDKVLSPRSLLANPKLGMRMVVEPRDDEDDRYASGYNNSIVLSEQQLVGHHSVPTSISIMQGGGIPTRGGISHDGGMPTNSGRMRQQQQAPGAASMKAMGASFGHAATADPSGNERLRLDMPTVATATGRGSLPTKQRQQKPRGQSTEERLCLDGAHAVAVAAGGRGAASLTPPLASAGSAHLMDQERVESRRGRGSSAGTGVSDATLGVPPMHSSSDENDGWLEEDFDSSSEDGEDSADETPPMQQQQLQRQAGARPPQASTDRAPAPTPSGAKPPMQPMAPQRRHAMPPGSRPPPGGAQFSVPVQVEKAHPVANKVEKPAVANKVEKPAVANKGEKPAASKLPSSMPVAQATAGGGGGDAAAIDVKTPPRAVRTSKLPSRSPQVVEKLVLTPFEERSRKTPANGVIAADANFIEENWDDDD